MKKEIIKFLVERRIKRIQKIYGKKVLGIEKSDLNIDLGLALKHKAKWGKIHQNFSNVKWLNSYVNSTKIQNSNFVPESIFYSIIEPIVNSRELNLAYADKNIYDLIYPQNLFPATILRNINDSFLDHSYSAANISSDADLEKLLKDYIQLLVKPALESGGGLNIYLFKRSGSEMIDSNGNKMNLSFLNRYLKNDYIIQEVLSQHDELRKFNITSLNTIRVLTWLSPISGKVEILHCIFRVGAKGQFVDNSRSGGYAIGIKPNGVLNNFATNKAGKHFATVNEIDLSKNHKIPFIGEIKKMAKEVSFKYLHFRLLGLDMTIDSTGNVQCIEINNKGNEINFYQLNNGPLFGEFTDEVIDYCIENKLKMYKNYDI
jgi:hypothetical protein